MRILAMDSAAGSVSAAVLENEHVLTEVTSNTGRNASIELMPMVEFVLRSAGIGLSEVDLMSCTAGPGSFTGLRIGIATIKGLALATGKPLVGVSTLKALACPLARPNMRICSMIDARKSQVYAALYVTDARGDLRQTRSDGLFDVAAVLGDLGRDVVFVGSGAGRYSNEIRRVLSPDACIASDHHHLVRASVVGRLGLQDYREGKRVDPIHFTPRYFRVSDAERNAFSPEEIHLTKS